MLLHWSCRRGGAADIDNPGYFLPILGIFLAILYYLRLNPGYLPPIYRHIIMDCRCPPAHVVGRVPGTCGWPCAWHMWLAVCLAHEFLIAPETDCWITPMFSDPANLAQNQSYLKKIYHLLLYTGCLFFWPPPNLTKSQALYKLNWPPPKIF